MIEKNKTVIVLFWATWDLARRYILPAISDLLDFQKIHVVLVGRRDWSLNDSINYVDWVLQDQDTKLIPAEYLSYAKVDLFNPSNYSTLSDTIHNILEPDDQVLYYLSLGPDFFIPVIQWLAYHNLHDCGKDCKPRIMIEKPFGRDLASATKLNLQMHEFFKEDQIYRVDHYLGKNAVVDLHKYRLNQWENWYSKRVKSIRVIANETLTVLDRGEFYDANGAVRDFLQNHLLQILAIAAMRAPITDSADEIRDKKMQFLQSITPFLIDPRHDILFGQYEWYQNEKWIQPNSRTETFIRTKMHSDDPLWEWIVFQVQTGKWLHEKKTEISIEFQDGASVAFRETSENKNNSYVKLLGDAIRWDQTLFVRWDSIKAAWIIVDELLSCTSNCPILYPYKIWSEWPKMT